ncbi:MAG TPA: DedA family protein [Gammaproteobacteria bacterium]|nr:DedA family protein [Gammaproteobacteria bacterium]
MRVFSALYERVMKWSEHRHAPWYLAGLSFSESSFFPVPPDVMLAPMALARPARAWHYAALTTAASVLGGVIGYLIGGFAFEAIQPWLQDSQYWPAYQQAREWFDKWGVWAVLVAGFSPIPYKVFTIAAGTVAMPMLPFIMASAMGRGGRFFLVAGLMRWGGERMQKTLKNYIDRLGWLAVLLLIGLYLTVGG